MKRCRGRRVALLLASALPLLATEEEYGGGQPQQEIIRPDDDQKAEDDHSRPLLYAHNDDSTNNIMSLSDASSSSWHAEWTVYNSNNNKSNNKNDNVTNQTIIPVRLPWETLFELEYDENESDPPGDDPLLLSVLLSALVPTEDEENNNPHNETTLEATSNQTSNISTHTSTPPPTSSSSSSSLSRSDDVFVVDYASKSAGGLILDKSPHFHGTSNLLTSDKDKYALVDCLEPDKWIVIGLSEDILVKQIGLAMYERYSSHVHEFSVSASTKGREWIDCGRFVAAHQPGREQYFDLPHPVWARYVKLHVWSHYGDEDLCTISQIKVHGSTVLQGFHEQWEEQENVVVDDDVVQVEPSEPRHPISVPAWAEQVDLEQLVQLAEASSTTTSSALYSMDWLSTTQSSSSSSTLVPRWVPALGASKPLFGTNGNLRDDVCLWATPHQYHSSTPVRSPTEAAIVQQIQERIQSNAIKINLLEGVVVKGIAAGRRDMENTPTGSETAEFIPLTATTEEGSNSTEVVAAGTATASESKTVVDPPTDSTSSAKPKDIAATTTTSINTSKTEDVPTQAANNNNSTEYVTAEETTQFLMKLLLDRIPSASCLEELAYDSVRTSQLKKARMPHGGTNPAGSSGGAVEPIFKKLTDEIKALQAHLGVHDHFTRQAVTCYQRVLFDLFSEMETLRMEQNLRLDRLENELRGAVQWIVSLRRLVSPMFFGLLWWIGVLMGGLLNSVFGSYTAFVRTLIAVGLSVKVYRRKMKNHGASSEFKVARPMESSEHGEEGTPSLHDDYRSLAKEGHSDSCASSSASSDSKARKMTREDFIIPENVANPQLPKEATLAVTPSNRSSDVDAAECINCQQATDATPIIEHNH